MTQRHLALQLSLLDLTLPVGHGPKQLRRQHTTIGYASPKDRDTSDRLHVVTHTCVVTLGKLSRASVPTLAHCWRRLRQHLSQELLARANTSPRSCWRTAPTPLSGAVGALRQHLFWRFNTPVSPSKVGDWLYFNVRITSLVLILLA